ncbi:MAG TPA: glycosyltransferase family 4 protein [Trebonia sp.]|nr:glycosyltransferase family 4 protein [Trebonia sp.]
MLDTAFPAEVNVRIAMIANTRYESDARVRRAARALAERGHHVDFFAVSGERTAAGGDEQFLHLRRLRIRRQHATLARYVFEYGLFFVWSMTLVSILHMRRRYDVIYVHNMPNFLVFAGLVPKIGGAKIVLDVHDPAAELLASIRGSDLPAWLRLLAWAEERASLSFADAVVTVNEPMRKRLSAMCRGPATVVMNLPDTAVTAPVEAAAADPDGRNRIVYSGSIAHRNGVDLIVKALSLLEGEFPLLRLRIVGGGPGAESVRGLVKELGVEDRVEFAGFVTNDEVPPLVSGAAAGISPQRDDAFGSFVFSMKVAEYITLGLPVICSAISTMEHYFSDGELLFFEPGSADDLARAIRDLLNDPALAAKRAASSRIRLDQLDWPAQKEALVRTVEALAGREEGDDRHGLPAQHA